MVPRKGNTLAAQVQPQIETNLASLRKRIADAAARAHRPPESVRLIAVTKTVSLDTVEILYRLGLREFGENRVPVARPKIEAFTHDATWHMIGPIQRRKARDVAELFDTADSVDRYEVAEALNRRCEAQQTIMPILLEVNVSGESAKHGFTIQEVPAALDKIRALAHLRVEGLMTMAPFVDDPELARPVFAGLRSLAEQIGLPELSMGMSNDFEIAIEEGATQIRVGSALFV